MPASSREKRWATPSTSIEVVAPLHRRHDARTCGRRSSAGCGRARGARRRRRPRRRRARPRTGRPSCRSDGPVRLAAVAQLDRPADRGVGLRRPRLAQPEEGGPVEPGEEVAGVEHGGDQGDVGVPGRQVLVGRREPVEPRRVDVAGPDLRSRRAGRAGTTGSSCRPARRTVICDRARCRRAIASARSRPWAMTLAIIESYSGGMTSPSATPVSTRMPGPTGQRQGSRSCPAPGRTPAAGPRR